MSKDISKLKIAAFIFGFIVFVQVIGMALFFRNSNLLQASSFNQINSLISEVGDLKQENLILSQKINQQASENSINNQTLQNLYVQVAGHGVAANEQINSLKTGLQSYQQLLTQEQQKYQEQSSQLSNQLDQKEQQIQNLQQKKELEKTFTTINDDTFAVLFVGENQGLTDSIILAVVNPAKNKTTLISVPRDLYYQGRKINEYYEFYGINKLIDVVQDVSGIRADKHVVFNFDSFKTIINSIGGIDIKIDKSIVDNSYPTANKGYKTVTFNAGIEKMDGERALEYARSRKSTSDFDRSARQQSIVAAIRQNLATQDVMKNVNFYLTAYQSASQDMKTDFNVFEAVQLYDQYKNFDLHAGNVLSNQNFLYSSTSTTGQSILLPKNSSFSAFQQKVLEII